MDFEAVIAQASSLYLSTGNPASTRTLYDEKISEWVMILEDQDEVNPAGVQAVEALWIAFAKSEQEMRQFKQVRSPPIENK
jgi:hypothetical protein